MGGQIIDASIVAAPKQHNTDGENRDVKEGRILPEWVNKPAKLPPEGPRRALTVNYPKAKALTESILRFLP